MANKKISELTKVSNLEKTALFITETSAGTRAVSFEDLLSKIKEIFLDTNKPSGAIRIGSKAYTTWKDTVSFDTYYNENQSVTIEASDNESGVKEIAYYIATTGLDNADLEAVEWTTYSGAFTIQPNNNYIVYAKITDNANNVTYICSDGIVLDNISPVFTGMEDGGTYPVGTVLTLNDGETLTVNGTAVELTDNSYTFTESMDNIQLSITDRAGNNTIITVTFGAIQRNFSISKDNCYMAGIEPSGDMVIPSSFEYENINYTVTSISEEAFLECTNLTSVIIPNSVTTIGDTAFALCSELVSISIPDNLEYIGIAAFALCSKLISVIGEISFINDQIFRECSSLQNITLSENLKYNGFENTNINLAIRNSAFERCENLTSINIPNGVQFIDGSAFYECKKLVLTIPNSVSVIHDSAFYDVPHIYYNGSATGAPWGAKAIN